MELLAPVIMAGFYQKVRKMTIAAISSGVGQSIP